MLVYEIKILKGSHYCTFTSHTVLGKKYIGTALQLKWKQAQLGFVFIFMPLRRISHKIISKWWATLSEIKHTHHTKAKAECLIQKRDLTNICNHCAIFKRVLGCLSYHSHEEKTYCFHLNTALCAYVSQTTVWSKPRGRSQSHLCFVMLVSLSELIKICLILVSLWRSSSSDASGQL